MSFENTTQESGLTINVAKTKQLITLPDRRDPEHRLRPVDKGRTGGASQGVYIPWQRSV